jgi:hypothetical protein
MAYENSGRLFKNTDKKSDRSPDYTGDFTDASGKKMNVAAWIKAGTQGRDNWLSFTVSEQRAPQGDENLAQPDDDDPQF